MGGGDGGECESAESGLATSLRRVCFCRACGLQCRIRAGAMVPQALWIALRNLPILISRRDVAERVTQQHAHLIGREECLMDATSLFGCIASGFMLTQPLGVLRMAQCTPFCAGMETRQEF